MPDKPDIVVKDLNFSYLSVPVLKGVNLTVDKGEFASIVGPNGGGKTTLIKLLLGLLKPDSGTIQVLGKPPGKKCLKIGYMPQYAHLDLQFPVTVMDVLLMGRLGHARGPRFSGKDREKAVACLDEMQLGGLSGRLFNELSGGQRQRVLIARALACEPELLLLDEPTANVDPGAEQTLFDMLQVLNKRMTILVVSHDLGFVSQVVRSVICVNREVVVHPTSTLNGTLIKEMYGGDCRLVRHDHRCNVEGHSHE